MVKKSIAKLREKAPYVLKRKGHAKQKKKLLKAYHGKRLNESIRAHAAFEEMMISEMKKMEFDFYRDMKGCIKAHLVANCPKFAGHEDKFDECIEYVTECAKEILKNRPGDVADDAWKAEYIDNKKKKNRQRKEAT